MVERKKRFYCATPARHPLGARSRVHRIPSYTSNHTHMAAPRPRLPTTRAPLSQIVARRFTVGTGRPRSCCWGSRCAAPTRSCRGRGGRPPSSAACTAAPCTPAWCPLAVRRRRRGCGSRSAWRRRWSGARSPPRRRARGWRRRGGTGGRGALRTRGRRRRQRQRRGWRGWRAAAGEVDGGQRGRRRAPGVATIVKRE